MIRRITPKEARWVTFKCPKCSKTSWTVFTNRKSCRYDICPECGLPLFIFIEGEADCSNCDSALECLGIHRAIAETGGYIR